MIRVRTGQRQTGEDGRTFLLEEELTGEDSVGCIALLLIPRFRQQRSRLPSANEFCSICLRSVQTAYMTSFWSSEWDICLNMCGCADRPESGGLAGGHFRGSYFVPVD